MDKKPDIVLTFTGGIDSSVLAGYYLEKGLIVRGVYFDYGQKIIRMEKKAMRHIGKFLKNKYKKKFSYEIIKLNRLKKYGFKYKSGTIRGVKKREINLSREELTSSYLWTPARNLYFLAEILAYAEVVKAKKIAFSILYFPPNNSSAENWTFPDETTQWCLAAKEITKFSNMNGIKFETLFIDLKKEKEDVIKIGSKLEIPLEKTYNCLLGKYPQCGICPHCARRKLIFKKLNLNDTKYEK